jgi:hypothetical protein
MTSQTGDWSTQLSQSPQYVLKDPEIVLEGYFPSHTLDITHKESHVDSPCGITHEPDFYSKATLTKIALSMSQFFHSEYLKRGLGFPQQCQGRVEREEINSE